MRGVTADTHTWLAARTFLLTRCDDFYLQLTRARENFDAEAIHDLRVSSRRLREGISIFADCFRKRRLVPVRQELKNLTEMLGVIRNCDEALLFFSPLVNACNGDPGETVMTIIARLQEERVAEQSRLKHQLKKIDPDRLLHRIDDLCSSPRIFNPASDALFVPVATTILQAVAVREKTMLDLLPEALVEEQVSAQHRLRVAVKRFRYRVEFLASFANSSYKAVYATIKEYQEILGHMHDLDIFIGLIPAPAGEAGKNRGIRNIINERRSALFRQFISLHQAHPLDKTGDLVRGLL